jgi:PKHD-type hydroxylase
MTNTNFLELKLLEDASLTQIWNYLNALKNDENSWSSGLKTFKGDPNTKNNEELTNIFFGDKIKNIIYDNVTKNKHFSEFCFPKNIDNILITRTSPGGYYNLHNDIGFNGHISCTIFLSDPNSYEGGELCLYIGNNEERIKLAPGHGILYETGISHRVNTVESGNRYVIVFWIKSIFKDPTLREICRDLSSIDLSVSGENLIKTDSNPQKVMNQNSFKLNNIINKIIRRYADL